MNNKMGVGPWQDGIKVRIARVVLSAGWGERPTDVPLWPVPGLSLSGRPDPLTIRPLRPVLPLRVGADGALAVPADAEESLVDFRPDADGGVRLLEVFENADGEWRNRLRYVNTESATTWSRQGKVDFQHTNPYRLVGVCTGLQRGMAACRG